MELIHVSGNTDCLLGKTAVGIYRIDDTRCILFDNGYSKEYDELVGSLKDAGLTPAGLIVSTRTSTITETANACAKPFRFHWLCRLAKPG